MNHWNQYDDAEGQREFNVIPKGTLVKVVSQIKAGGYNHPELGITGGFATVAKSGAIFLKMQYTIVAGPFSKRKIHDLVGLHSPKGDTWMKQGRSFIKAMLESARGIHPNQPSQHQERFINGFGDLNGLNLVVQLSIEADDRNGQKNVIQRVITPDHPDYQALMHQQAPGNVSGYAYPVSNSPPTSQHSTQSSRLPAHPRPPQW